ncbi:MAG: 2-amino-4-hydroxy-6-hydroxymethyldihydropteridine diphosphokinase [marine bacterium B5-7]|nr:MAG: 2-amino-4-hydroxy-6-hydroxymethyldihydropteridine diphosphokinase [marine bacterium B5-7]
MAIERLSTIDGVRILARSSIYRSAPVDYDEQDDFINAVVQIETDLDPEDLLDELQRIENDLGRTRTGPRFGPRRIDLDLLMVDDIVLQTPRLELPHPRMHQRRFVLEPMVEIDNDVDIPGFGEARELLAKLEGQVVSVLDIQ